MRIGIDLDNTIINYNSAFRIGALRVGHENCRKCTTKNQVKSKILDGIDGQMKWEMLQGKIYGEWIDLAKIYSGFFRFLKRAISRDFYICIVSHKTEYGHHCKKNISLRESAKYFLRSKGIEVEEGNHEKIRICFLNTKSEKIRKIHELKLDYFVDDLLEVFQDENFSSQTKKILFDDGIKVNNSSIRSANNWDDINQFLLGSYQDLELKNFAREFSKGNDYELKKFNTGKNAKTFLLRQGNIRNSIIKLYPADENHNRLYSEFTSFYYLREYGIENIPHVLSKNINLEIANYTLIDGEKVISNGNLLPAMIDLVSRLKNISEKEDVSMFNRASASCLDLEDIFNQIYERLRQILLCCTPDLEDYLIKTIKPFIHKECEKLDLAEERGIIQNELNTNLFLSPSDFGRHNSLVDKSGKISFIDFEYFGLDDPAKFICDTAIHPGSNWTNCEREQWFSAMFNQFGKDVMKRVKVCFPLYALNWVLIMLNKIVKERINHLDSTPISQSHFEKVNKYLKQNYLTLQAN
jgi:hypothetical protein